MTPTKRIFLNTIATYGRSLVALALGLFSVRWVLGALGKSDFGLWGVVGSLIAFISVLNTTLSASVARFYAYSIGEDVGKQTQDAGVDLKGWFYAAMQIHVALAVMMLVVGWPLGEYLLSNVLVIPSDRLAACQWVFRFSLLSSLVSVVSVPYCALFNAYQNIVELSFFEIARVIINFAIAFVLLSVSGDRLIFYGGAMTLCAVFISALQMARARILFLSPIRMVKFSCNVGRIREIGKYATVKFLGVFGWMAKMHGTAMAINMFFTPVENAAYNIGNQVVAQTTALATSLTNAIAPAITTIAGEGDRQKMINYSLRACKYGGLLVILFAAPLICEIDYVLRLWLVDPPTGASMFCCLFLIAFLVESISLGYVIAICAETKIAGWQATESVLLFSVFPMLIAIFKLGGDVRWTGYVFIAIAMALVTERVYFARRLYAIHLGDWVRNALLPVTSVLCSSIFVGQVVVSILAPSFCRLILTCVSTLISACVLGWMIALNQDEKEKVLEVCFMIFHRGR